MALIRTETQVTGRARIGRVLVAIAIVAAFGIGAVAYLMRTPADGPAVPGASIAMAPAKPDAPATPPIPAAVAASPAIAAPSFDVVRVGPQGNAVIAGRAEPGAEVVVRDGSKEIARTQADRQGAFVAIPAAPLPEGGRSLTLDATVAAGKPVPSDGAVVVVVPPQPVAAPSLAAVSAPPPASTPTQALAVLVPNAGAPRVLQQAPVPGTRAVGLDTVDYDDKGAIRFTGHAAAGSAMRVYVDNQPVGDATADGAGRWVLTPGDAVTPGVHNLRVDRLDAAGKVTARVELPFQRASLPPAELAASHVVIQPGQNLWRLARTAYGSGARYTVIYLANRDTIRDPQLIYPGQAFSVPAATP